MSQNALIRCPDKGIIKLDNIKFINKNNGCNLDKIKKKFENGCNNKSSCSIETLTDNECKGYEVGIQYSCVNNNNKTYNGEINMAVSKEVPTSGTEIATSKISRMDKISYEPSENISQTYSMLNQEEYIEEEEDGNVNLVKNQEEESVQEYDDIIDEESIIMNLTNELPERTDIIEDEYSLFSDIKGKAISLWLNNRIWIIIVMVLIILVLVLMIILSLWRKRKVELTFD